MAQKSLIQHVAMERKCKIDELISTNVDYRSFLPRSKSWLKVETPSSIIPKPIISVFALSDNAKTDIIG